MEVRPKESAMEAATEVKGPSSMGRIEGKRVSITVFLKMLSERGEEEILAECTQDAGHVRGHVASTDDVANVMRSPENHKIAFAVDHAVVGPVP